MEDSLFNNNEITINVSLSPAEQYKLNISGILVSRKKSSGDLNDKTASLVASKIAGLVLQQSSDRMVKAHVVKKQFGYAENRTNNIAGSVGNVKDSNYVQG